MLFPLMSKVHILPENGCQSISSNFLLREYDPKNFAGSSLSDSGAILNFLGVVFGRFNGAAPGELSGRGAYLV